MNSPDMDTLDRHALVLAIWLSFGLAALIMLRTGLVHGGWGFVMAGFAMIIAAFAGHVIVNTVLHTRFTRKEVALGLVLYAIGLVVLAAAALFSFSLRAYLLPVSLGLIAIFVVVVFYMITHLGIRRAFEAFDVIRQFRQ